MYKTSTEITVGSFVVLGALSLAYLTFFLGEAVFFGNPFYTVVADFDSVTGLRTGASVEIAGVQVGRILDISLDENRARVTMGIRKGVKLSRDTVASVRTKGIIGDMFIKLTPGGSPEVIEPDGRLTETESAISIEELVSKYIFEGK